ncbi:MAG: FixH family protein [Gammaproteobacteria bacterium]|nr:FixH family protein [Gammaproteobacteria bacterium]
MASLVYTLLGGALSIVIVFLLALKVLRVEPKALAGLMALLVLGIFVPVAIVFWPGADVFAVHLAIYMITVYALGIIFSQRATHDASSGHWFHWGPAAIIGFFMFIVAVDAILIVVAQKGLHKEVALKFLPAPRSGGKVSSFFPGTVSHDFREKEELFNRYIEQRREQKERNWQVRLGWAVDPLVDKETQFQIHVTDKDGKAISKANVTGQFMRPADSKLDQDFTMQEGRPGYYQVALTMTVPGQWELILNIKQGESLHEIRARTNIGK